MIETEQQRRWWFGTEFASKSPAEQHALLWGDEAKAGSDDDSEEDTPGTAYGWAKDNWEEARDIELSVLLGPLASPQRVDKAIRSLEKQLTKREQRLQDCMKDPDAHDNRRLLKNASTPEKRQQIIQGRIENLQKQIRTFRRDIARLRGGRR